MMIKVQTLMQILWFMMTYVWLRPTYLWVHKKTTLFLVVSLAVSANCGVIVAAPPGNQAASSLRKQYVKKTCTLW